MQEVRRFESGRLHPDFSPFALAGFVAGEGSFIVTTAQPPLKSGAARPRFVFQVSIAERDRDVLEQLRRALGFGSIHVVASRKPGHLAQAVYTIASLRAHERSTIPFFGAFLITTAKRRQFERWREAILAWETDRPPRWSRGRSTCSEPGCEELVRGRGLCRRHYYRATGH